jgi:bifunctional non-homologous end joining protein LigD
MSGKDSGAGRVELSNTDKVLFPDDGITKGQLIDHYREVAAVMLPHIEDRPLTLHRFPDGIGSDGFYQQRAADYFPDWIKTYEAARAGDDAETIDHVLCNQPDCLVYLANLGTITLHGWLSRAPDLDHPDRLIFDLDPAGGDFDPVRKAARQVAELMQSLGMNPYAMTTGSRGLHLVAPLRADAGFDAVRALATDMAAWLARQHPDALTVEQRKDKRGGRIYLDVMRNAYGQTGVMPYAVRALPGAPVATPLDLEELGDAELAPRRWHLGNIRRRLGQKGDPWSDIRRHATSTAGARAAIAELEKD